jgi:hypothetical protein
MTVLQLRGCRLDNLCEQVCVRDRVENVQMKLPQSVHRMEAKALFYQKTVISSTDARLIHPNHPYAGGSPR